MRRFRDFNQRQLIRFPVSYFEIRLRRLHLFEHNRKAEYFRSHCARHEAPKDKPFPFILSAFGWSNARPDLRSKISEGSLEVFAPCDPNQAHV
jgi:hypothetical protein